MRSFQKKRRRSNRFVYSGLKFGKKADAEIEKSDLVIPEADLQEYANDLLDSKGIQYIRFENGFLGWMRRCAPARWASYFFKVWSGQPDNICFIKLDNGFSMCLRMELKKEKTGRLHGKQIFRCTDEGWVVCSTIEQINEAIDRFEREANAYNTAGNLPF
jgi:hypothetical protein